MVEANPAKLLGTNVAGRAGVLADYLVSEMAWVFLADFAAKEVDGFPLFYPPEAAPAQSGG